MALFKIFDNTASQNDLPNTYNPGYCYFDVRTQKFYIDTTNAAAGRKPLNGLRANVADMANSIIFGTCTTAANVANKMVIIDKPTDITTDVVINGYPFESLVDGLMFAVYFEHGNSALAPYITFQLNDGTQTTLVGDIYCNALTPATDNELFSWQAGSLVIFTLITSASLGNKCIMANWQDLSSLSTLSFSLDSSIPSAELDYNPTDATDSTFSLGSFVTHDEAAEFEDISLIPQMFGGYTIDSFVLTNNYDTKLPLANGARKGLIYSNTTNTSGFSLAPVVDGQVYYKTETATPGKLTVTSKDNQTPAGHAQTLLSNYQGGVDLTLELTPHKINAVDLYGDTMYGTLTINNADLRFTPSSASEDTGDIVWFYNSGSEKARLYISDTYTTNVEGPHYRQYSSDGTLLQNGFLLTDSTVSRYALPFYETTTCDVDTITQQGLYENRGAITNAPTTNHGSILYLNNIGTPTQIFIPDYSYTLYKRYYTGGAWTAWKMIADDMSKYAIAANYVAKSGDTLTGGLNWTGLNSTNFSVGFASGGTSSDVGWSYSNRNGAIIGLRSVNYTNNPGAFEIFARDATNSPSLVGKPNGTLTWNGATLLTSGTGVTINTAQTITGQKTLSQPLKLSFNSAIAVGSYNAGSSSISLDSLITNCKASNGCIGSAYVNRFSPLTAGYYSFIWIPRDGATNASYGAMLLMPTDIKNPSYMYLANYYNGYVNYVKRIALS